MFSVRQLLLKKGFRTPSKGKDIPNFVYKETGEIANSRKKIIRLLKPYIWPKDISARRIIVGATVLLVVSKGLNAYIPFMLKNGIDNLAQENPNFTNAFMVFGAFGLGKIAVVGASELRATLLNKVTLNALRDICNRTYTHLFSLDLAYHNVSTKLTLTALQRARNGVQMSLLYTLNHILPTTLEFILASGVLIGYCGLPYFATLIGTVTTYSAFTMQYTKIRKEYLKEMRMKEKAAEFVANEGLVNFETVKYFTGEN
jgi:ABC-type multidrug transport system fused ATPase/permease subunit